jgi:hypothetical protein
MLIENALARTTSHAWATRRQYHHRTSCPLWKMQSLKVSYLDLKRSSRVGFISIVITIAKADPLTWHRVQRHSMRQA